MKKKTKKASSTAKQQTLKRAPARRNSKQVDTSARRGHLLTEQRNPRTMALDQLNIEAAFDAMNAEDASVPAAVAKARPAIVRAIKAVTFAWQAGGRLIYVGAGTSGRLGVLDASECPPTFRSDPKMVRGIIAGGQKALWRSIEGAEDDTQAARDAIESMKVTARDVVMGVATGGTTPYVHAALDEAKRHHATTVFFACVPASQAPTSADIDIRVLTGPEVLTGSTRLKAGTATKLTLNMITTLGMVGLGKTYGNLMVDLNSFACRKLVDRATRVVSEVADVTYETAAVALQAARGRAKAAIVMLKKGLDAQSATEALDRAKGRIGDLLRVKLG